MEEVEGVIGGDSVGAIVALRDVRLVGDAAEAVAINEGVPSAVEVDAGEGEARGRALRDTVIDAEALRVGRSPSVRVAVGALPVRVAAAPVHVWDRLGGAEGAPEGLRAPLREGAPRDAVLAAEAAADADEVEERVTILEFGGVADARALRERTDVLALTDADADLLTEELLVPVFESGAGAEARASAVTVSVGWEREGRGLPLSRAVPDAAPSRAVVEAEPDARALRVVVADADEHTERDRVTDAESEKVRVARPVFE